jgi:hypothetical protein
LVYIANKTKQAFWEFEKYIDKKRQEQKSVIKYVSHLGLNDRQTKLLSYFLKNPNNYTNNSIHKNYNWIAVNTSKSDLEDLFSRWFLVKKKQWKYVNYFPVINLNDLIK